MSRDYDNGEPENQRGAQRAPSGAQAWPVLAQLPRIGAAQPPARELSPAPPTRTPIIDDAAPRIVERPSGQPAAPAPSRQRYSVDPPHCIQSAPIELGVPASEQDDLPAVETPLTASSVRRFRVDQAASHRPIARKPARQREETTFSGSIFRAHAALAPYMGLIGAAALMVCGGLMYWMAFSRSDAPFIIANPPAPSANSGLSHDAPAAERIELNHESTNASALSAPPIDFAPHVANANAAASSEAEQQGTAPAPASPNESGGPSLDPAAATPASSEQPVTTSMYEPITPTPEVATLITTPYPAFSFTSPAPAVEVYPVAERMPAPSTPSNTTR